MKNKNGKIELYRFLFCLYVFLFHLCKYELGEPELGDDIHMSFFAQGAIGVEFFFVLSGFFMARSLFARISRDGGAVSGEVLAADSLQFMKKKYLGIFPQHTIAFVLVFAAYVYSKSASFAHIVRFLIQSAPCFFLVNMSGYWITNPNHIEWYISCMLLSMAILYPLCRRHYYLYTRYAGPLLSIFIIGYTMYTTQSLTGVVTWMGLSFKAMLRSFSEITLGMTGYELARWMSARTFTKPQRLLLTLVEAGAFLFATCYTLSTAPRTWQPLVLAGFVLMVPIAYAQISYGSRFFEKPLFGFLGSLSLPIYLGQLTGKYAMDPYLTVWSKEKRMLWYVVISLAASLVIYVLDRLYSKAKKRAAA